MEPRMTKEEVIADLHHILRGHISSRTIKQCRDRLDLLEYLITPKHGFEATPYETHNQKNICMVCHRHKPIMYNLNRQADEKDYWVCEEHIPKEITFPIGMHGEAFAERQKRNKEDDAGRTDNQAS
jgi:hypothetical protein